MESNFLILFILATSGWVWAISLYTINRHDHFKRKHKISRYQTYTIYMKRTYEFMKKIRPSKSMLSRLSTEYLKIHSNYDNDIVQDLLIEFKNELLTSFNDANKPIGVIELELNALLLNCSEEVAVMAREMKKLAKYCRQEIWYLLELAESEDTTPFIITLNTLKDDKKWGKIERLQNTVKHRMEKEIREMF